MRGRGWLAAGTSMCMLATVGCCCKPPKKSGPASEASVPEPAATLDAPLEWPNPKAVCAYLDGAGLATHGYKAYDRSRPTEMTCQAVNRRLRAAGGGEADPGESSLTFSAEGTPEAIDHMRVRVAVFRRRKDEQKALDEFYSTVDALIHMAFRASTPPAAVATLRAGRSGKWDLPSGHRLEGDRWSEEVGPFGPVYQVNAELR
jgi:hypothetical protein